MKPIKKLHLVSAFSIFLLILLAIALLKFPNTFVMAGILGSLAMYWLFYLVDCFFKIEFELRHYIYFLLIAFLGALLNPLYFFIGTYDKALHFLTPLLWCAVIFFVVNKRLKANLFWKLIITLCIFISIMVVHEVAEYLLDVFFNLKMQGVYTGDFHLGKVTELQSRIDDTMLDLIFDFLGGLFFIILKSFSYSGEKKTIKK